jgi:hypothetical protein
VVERAETQGLAAVSAAVTGAALLLSLHVLAAFAVAAPVAALLVTEIAMTAGGSERANALGGLVRASAVVFRAGVAATLVFGLWLVFTRDSYSLWDGWVIAALLLWVAIGGLGDAAISRLKKVVGAEDEAGRLRRVLWLEAGAAAAVLAELAVMLWRPGS